MQSGLTMLMRKEMAVGYWGRPEKYWSRILVKAEVGMNRTCRPRDEGKGPKFCSSVD